MKPIISGPILFDLIVNLYDDQKEFCLTLFKNLLDQYVVNDENRIVIFTSHDSQMRDFADTVLLINDKKIV